MKEIKEFILEKFKINSNTISDQREYKIVDGKDNQYSKQEMNQIADCFDSLDILPEDMIFSYNTARIKYYRSPEIKAGWHVHNFIKIIDQTEGEHKLFKVAFCAIDHKSYYWFPEHDPEIEGYPLQKCLEIIKEKWKEIKFDKSIKKYS